MTVAMLRLLLGKEPAFGESWVQCSLP